MEELQLTLTPARVDQRNFGVMLSNWRVGQVINAMVVDRMPSGNLLLKCGRSRICHASRSSGPARNRLQLEVQQVTPQLVLRLLRGPRKAARCQGESLARPMQSGAVPNTSTPFGGGTTAALLSAVANQPNLRALWLVRRQPYPH